jgi:hypothetical protein
VTVTPPATLLHPASVTYDVLKATNGPTPIGDGNGLRLGSGVDSSSPPTTDALDVTGRKSPGSLVFTGITFDLGRVFGLVDDAPLGKVVSAPSCVSGCCADGGVTDTFVPKACGCAVLGAAELLCLQERCERTALENGCSVR